MIRFRGLIQFVESHAVAFNRATRLDGLPRSVIDMENIGIICDALVSACHVIS